VTVRLSDSLSTTLPRGIKRSARRAAQAIGRATGPLRLLPDYLVIGEARCGTTSFYKWLIRHPAVGPVLTKEVQYFSDHYDRGLSWYRGHFPTNAYAKVVERRQGTSMVTGEASPYYLFHPHARDRILATVPDVKLIVILRDPVARAFSLWQQQRDLEMEALSFADAIEAEAGRLAGERERMLADPTYDSLDLKHHSYVARGDYASSLSRWFEVVPKERFMIVRAEDMFADPAGTMEQAHRFLGLPPRHDQAYPPLNAGSGTSIDPEVARRLRTHYDEPNRRLAHLVGRDFGWDGP
jgi:Sulfotransferase domain